MRQKQKIEGIVQVTKKPTRKQLERAADEHSRSSTASLVDSFVEAVRNKKITPETLRESRAQCNTGQERRLRAMISRAITVFEKEGEERTARMLRDVLRKFMSEIKNE